MFSSIFISADGKSKHYKMVIEKLKLLLLLILNVVLKVHLLWFKAERMKFWKDLSLKVFVAASRGKFLNFLYTKYSTAENPREKLKFSPKPLRGPCFLSKISRGHTILDFIAVFFIYGFLKTCLWVGGFSLHHNPLLPHPPLCLSLYLFCFHFNEEISDVRRAEHKVQKVETSVSKILEFLVPG